MRAEFGKGDRQQSKINAGDAVAKGEGADRRAQHNAQRDRKPQSGPGTDAEMEIEPGRGVSADAEIKRMAEGELAGETHHDIPRLAGVSEEQKERHHRQEVLTGDGGQKNQNRTQGREP